MCCIATSLLSIARATWIEAAGCRETVKVGWIWVGGFDGSFTSAAVFRIGLLVSVAVSMAMNIARLAGICYCESHILNLTTGCVEIT
mmetsp:Transcript_137825/g.440164  ORF Transcript_137825/g.440164 Transcript_137825/m.440164 type:complete len:87 (+) Transcript_137825:179-439(+)